MREISINRQMDIKHYDTTAIVAEDMFNVWDEATAKYNPREDFASGKDKQRLNDLGSAVMEDFDFENAFLNDFSDGMDCEEEILLVPNPPEMAGDALDNPEKKTLILSGEPVTKLDELRSLERPREDIFCSTYEEFHAQLQNLELDTYTKFVITKTKGSFSKEVRSVRGKRVRWMTEGRMKDMPFVMVGTRYFSCQFCAAPNAATLLKYAEKREEKRKQGLCKRYNRSQGTRKLGCPFKFVANRYLFFPDLQVRDEGEDVKKEREEAKSLIEKKFRESKYESKYVCKIPDAESHKFHPVISKTAQKEPLDGRVLLKIKELVVSGKTDPDDVLEMVEEYVMSELNVIDRERRRFFPSRSDVVHAANRTKIRLRISDIEDQGDRLAHLGSLGPEVFYRPMVSESKKGVSGTYIPNFTSPYIFVYQNEEMKRLFRLYGRNCFFLDAIHRYCEYIWPIYFIIVNTHSSYQVVGFFVIQQDCKFTIGKALEVIRSWNPEISPKYAVTNRPWDEIKGIEIVYPKIKVFCSNYHRNLFWEKKLFRKENDGLDRKVILDKLNNVANARNVKDLKSALEILKSDASYQSSSVKSYYEYTWHRHMRRWAHAFYPDDLYFEVNDGVKRLPGDIKYNLLQDMKTESIYCIINTLISTYIPDNLKQYERENEIIHSKPSVLAKFSEWFVRWVLSVHFEATRDVQNFRVEETSRDSFRLSSVVLSEDVVLTFNSSQTKYICTCPKYSNERIPLICKHVIIVGLKFPEYTLPNVLSMYKNPVFFVDPKFNRLRDCDSKNPDFLNCDMYVNSENISESRRASAKQKDLLSLCKDEIQSLDSMCLGMDSERLEDLWNKLRAIREDISHSMVDLRKEYKNFENKSSIDFYTEEVVDQVSSFLEDSDQVDQLVIKIES